jgi:hypothetical protein
METEPPFTSSSQLQSISTTIYTKVGPGEDSKGEKGRKIIEKYYLPYWKGESNVARQPSQHSTNTQYYPVRQVPVFGS